MSNLFYDPEHEEPKIAEPQEIKPTPQVKKVEFSDDVDKSNREEN